MLEVPSSMAKIFLNRACPKFDRKAYCPAARGRPSVVIDSEFGFYLGNETDQEMSLNATEICGFNTGAYQQKAISGRP